LNRIESKALCEMLKIAWLTPAAPQQAQYSEWQQTPPEQ
jgi:hypothetical protein